MSKSRGERNIRWIEKHCIIPEGKFVGKNVVLRDFQRKIVTDIYDSPTRKAIISFGRKNAKTALAAFFTILHLVGPEARRNSQLVSTAQSREQAGLIFNYAKKSIEMSPTLCPAIHIVESKKNLICEKLGTVYKALSAESKTNLGLSPVFSVHDELGQVNGPYSALYDAVETACGAHDDPLSIIISTQAASDGDLLSLEIDDAITGVDPKKKLFFFSASKDLDPFSEEAIRAANPAFGDFLNATEVLQQAADAKRMPTKAATFKNLILNQRLSATECAISPEIWKENGEIWDDFDEELPTYGAIDLSETSDLAAFALIQEKLDGKIAVRCKFWLPEEGLEDKSKVDHQPYDIWAKSEEKWLKTTPGRSLDYDLIAKEVFDDCERLNVIKIAYDRWRWKIFKKALLNANFPDWVLEPDGNEIEKDRSIFYMFGQGFQSMGPAWLVFEKALLTGKLQHAMHPVLTMCASNCVTVSDPAGNKKIVKNKCRGRVDGIVALIMALGVKALYEADNAGGDLDSYIYPIEVGESDA